MTKPFIYVPPSFPPLSSLPSSPSSIPCAPSLMKKAITALLMTLLSHHVMAQQSGPLYGHIIDQTIIKSPIDNSAMTGPKAFANNSELVSQKTLESDSHSLVIANKQTVIGDAFGGAAILHVQSGEAKGGQATSTGDSTYSHSYVNAQVYANQNTLLANRNDMVLEADSTVDGHVYGGYALQRAMAAPAMSGNATSTGAQTIADAHAYAFALATDSSVYANNNRVFVKEGASVGGNVYAGKAVIQAQSAKAIAGDSSGARATSFANAHAVTSNSTVSANMNTLTLHSNAGVRGDIFGGHSSMLAQSADSSAGSSVTEEETAGSTTNSHVDVRNTHIQSNNNTISIKNGATVRGSIYGGFSGLVVKAGTAISGYTNNKPENAYAFILANGSKVMASDNQVVFDGILQGGSIYGGYVQFDVTKGNAFRADGKAGDTHIDLSNTDHQATGNHITIGDNAQFLQPTSSIFGGYIDANPGWMPRHYDVFTGNTLNFSAKPIVIDQLANIEQYNFTLQPTLANTETALITANNVVLGTDVFTNNWADNKSTIRVVGIHSGPILKAGDQFYLIRSPKSFLGFGAEGETTQVQQGISLLYDVQTEVDQDNNVVTAKIIGTDFPSQSHPDDNPGSDSGHDSGPNANDNNLYDVNQGVKVNPQLRALPAGQLAGALLISRGTDLIAKDVLSSLRNQYEGLNLFAHGTGNHSRYGSGSQLKSNDMLLTAGVSYQQENLTGAFFVETGHSNYDSATRPTYLNKVHGDGQNRYYGAGLLGRYQFGNGFYADGSLRIGNSKNIYSSKDIVNLATGQYASYSLKSGYVSTHIGAGYVLPLSENNELDLSAKYIWTHLKGKDAVVAGDPISFNSIDSRRFGLNADLIHRYNENLTLNAGLGIDYEFDAKAKGSTYNIFAIEAPSMQGGTGIVSLGGTYQSESHPELSFDVKARGYQGKREGVSLGVTVNYQF